jgi:hypothetical protein
MCLQQDRGRKARQLDRLMPGLSALCERGRITWTAQEDGWTGQPEEVLDALATDGFHKCQGDTPVSSPARWGPVDGTWEGVNPHTRSVASVAWLLRRASQPAATVFIEIDGDTITSPTGNPGEGVRELKSSQGLVQG